jgi:indolepyruvate ferredoxin oxidoreductase alpha subunit
LPAIAGALRRAIAEESIESVLADRGQIATTLASMSTPRGRGRMQSHRDGADALTAAIELARSGARTLCLIDNRREERLDVSISRAGQTAVSGSLVVAVADLPADPTGSPPGDCRSWGRSAELPVMEPADGVELALLFGSALAMSDEFLCPVVLRLPIGSPSEAREPEGEIPWLGGDDDFWRAANLRNANPEVRRDPSRSRLRNAARMRELANLSDRTPHNELQRGADRKTGFIVAGPSYGRVRCAFPDATILKLGLSHPLPMKHVRGITEMCRQVMVIESMPLVAGELAAEGIHVVGGHPARLVAPSRGRQDM